MSGSVPLDFGGGMQRMLDRWVSIGSVAAIVMAAVVAAALPGTAAPAAAQEALVLSTGASRGLAHAGVVAGMEEKGHDPELVVGSSMGAVIGGLYAAGYGPDEIRVLLEDADWADIFKPMPLLLGPDRVARLPVIRVGVALTTLEVDRGFTPDWRLNRLLTRFFFDAGVRSRGDFDRLARRYRPVAADLETGEEVVLAEGDLARAVRASMGTPGFFSPVEWDGRLLTDGGVANYLPISVARDLGARMVVAADVSRPPPRVEAKNPVALAGRGIGLLMRNALPDTLPDILIRPRIDSDMPGVAFPDDPAPLIALGYEATLDALPPGPGHAVPGFAWGEERGRARAVVGLDLAHPIVLGGAARLRLRMGAAPDELEGFEREGSWVGGAALEGVWTAPFGPVVVGVGANTRGGQRLDVSLGPTF